jgi:hypothetical protein
MKRPMRGGFVGTTPVKQPRIAMPLPASPSQRRPIRPAVGSGPVNTLLCRLCAQLSSFCFPLKDKPEILESLRFVLGVEIDLDEDMEKGYPQFVCRKCATVISTYSDYKKVFEAAQIKLKMMKESEDRVSTTRIVSDNDDSILPGSVQLTYFSSSGFFPLALIIHKITPKLPFSPLRVSLRVQTITLHNFFTI